MKVNCAGLPLEFGVSFRPDSKTVRATKLPKTVKTEIVNIYGDPTRADDQAPVGIYYTTDRAGFRLPKSLPTELPTGQRLAHHGALSNRMVDYRDFMARYHLWQRSKHCVELIAFDQALRIFLDGFSEARVEEEPLRFTVKKGGEPGQSHHATLIFGESDTRVFGLASGASKSSFVK